jgi:hypothetical protein
MLLFISPASTVIAPVLHMPSSNGSGTEVIAYMAAPDLRYQILAMAAVKVGYVVCTLAHSIRNSILLIDTQRYSSPHLEIPWRLLSLC